MIGDISKGARLTRKTVAKILKGMGRPFYLFKENPEEFIRNTIKIIREQKAKMVVNHITYSPTEAEPYDSTIFTPERRLDINRALELSKHVTPYVTFYSQTERKFAESLNGANEVLIFAKIPRKLKIPTPVGDYAPDWAIVFKEGSVRHVFFVAETKGSLNEMDYRGVEIAKIECARKLFNSVSTRKVRYNVVDRFDKLYNIINDTE